MNMGSGSGKLVHQIVCEHESESLEAFIEELAANEFVIVDEFYREKDGRDYYFNSQVALSTTSIGKVRAFREDLPV
jgi:hypothetical protein